MTRVLASAVLANGLRTEFADAYTKIRNRQKDSRLGLIVDGIGATNRQHEFAYFNAAPHAEYWRRGDPIPGDSMDSVKFTAKVYEWGRRLSWSMFDRKDDQTQSLMDAAKMVGQSLALIPERMFFDHLLTTATTLPVVGTAPDGAALYATTAGGAARFGATNGNLLTGSGVSTVSQVLTDYYSALAQFLAFQDGKGQPLFSDETIRSGVVIVFGSSNLKLFEEAFLQLRQGIVYGSNTAAAAVTNIVQDASRNVDLWPSQRISQASTSADRNDWFVFLKNPPKKALFTLDREGVREQQALESDNNSDHVRNTGEEYVQWYSRQGMGIGPAYSTIKINNS